MRQVFGKGLRRVACRLAQLKVRNTGVFTSAPSMTSFVKMFNELTISDTAINLDCNNTFYRNTENNQGLKCYVCLRTVDSTLQGIKMLAIESESFVLAF